MFKKQWFTTVLGVWECEMCFVPHLPYLRIQNSWIFRRFWVRIVHCFLASVWTHFQQLSTHNVRRSVQKRVIWNTHPGCHLWNALAGCRLTCLFLIIQRFLSISRVAARPGSHICDRRPMNYAAYHRAVTSLSAPGPARGPEGQCPWSRMTRFPCLRCDTKLPFLLRVRQSLSAAC